MNDSWMAYLKESMPELYTLCVATRRQVTGGPPCIELGPMTTHALLAGLAMHAILGNAFACESLVGNETYKSAAYDAYNMAAAMMAELARRNDTPKEDNAGS